MASLSLTQCSRELQARLVGDAALIAQSPVTSVSTDTRTIVEGDTFVALLGPNHDGHEHIAAAIDKGASSVLVSREVDTKAPQLVVDDTRLALGSLARLWAVTQQVPVIAVTGSNGKTTVKEMLKSILSELGPVLATDGNLNNEIGVPLTLLKIQEAHHYAVVEMGANHVGEIGYLSKLANPIVALVNNVSSAHLEGFGSLDDVARAKSEIFLGVSDEGHAVINYDDDYAEFMLQSAKHCKRVTFGVSPGAQVSGHYHDDVLQVKTLTEEVAIKLPLLGQHNRQNALAAIAAVSCLDVQADAIRVGLEKMQPVAGRLERKTAIGGLHLIDDTYNANPASALAAVQVLAEQPGLRVFVLGDMLELGSQGESLHAEVGNRARELGIDFLYTYGSLAAHAAHAFGESGVSFSAKAHLIKALKKLRSSTTTCLIKGSRGARMEQVVDALMAQPKNGCDREVPTT